MTMLWDGLSRRVTDSSRNILNAKSLVDHEQMHCVRGRRTGYRLLSTFKSRVHVR